MERFGLHFSDMVTEGKLLAVMMVVKNLYVNIQHTDGGNNGVSS